MMSLQVKVTQGTLGGKLCFAYDGTKYYSFEGIPYAKPPIGQLRFMAPLEPESWTGVHDASKPGNKCAQLNPFGKGIVEGSEDCLYLNVYTPSLPAEKIENLPVIFFIHGGRLVVGYGDYYRPDYFLKHNVIVVTINYRLNILGFLCLDTPEVPGNTGLKDTVMALKWVKNNIKQFNGDDCNITAFGESAGAAIAASYLSTKMAVGLCDKIICQSGNSISDLYIVDEDPIDRASKIASYLGHEERDKRKLYDLFLNTSIEDLVYAYTSAEMNRPPSVVNAFLLPVVEKKFEKVEPFFHEHPSVAIRENRFQKLPILATIHSYEGAPFLRKDGEGNIYYEQDFQYFIPRFLSVKHNTPKALKIAKIIRDYYFKGRNVDHNTKMEYLNLFSDHFFARDILLFVELMSTLCDNVYLCRFGFNGNMNTRTVQEMNLNGAAHGDLIQYLFYRENKAKVATEKDFMTVNILIEAWCNFAKNGKPSWINEHLRWLPYTKEKKICLNIDHTGMKVEPYPNFERINFWFDLIRERAKL
ncbi:jg12038 [Pararge aegeria aegeria]|uniref:Jg12038 protein n=5 Tax=Pararge aegeria TaxID=116150 RepID=A0A8S4RWN5_9NEOP|nr:jg12038 [Pararge aegeria aegeria]